MAYIQDDFETFTITLTALLEGKGIIDYLEVYNSTQAVREWWTSATGWSGTPQAVETDSIMVYIDVANTGATTDTLFGEFVSAQVTPAEALIQEMPNVGVGFGDSVEWNFTMPPQNVTITINAGHVE